MENFDNKSMEQLVHFLLKKIQVPFFLKLARELKTTQCAF